MCQFLVNSETAQPFGRFVRHGFLTTRVSVKQIVASSVDGLASCIFVEETETTRTRAYEFSEVQQPIGLVCEADESDARPAGTGRHQK